MIGGFQEKELVQAIEKTYYQDTAALCTSSPGSFLRRETDMTIYASGLPVAIFNGVLGPRFSSKTISKRIEAAMAHFKEIGVPMSWVLGPSSAPKDLESALVMRGLIPGDVTPGMAIDLDDVEPVPTPAGLKVKQVKDMRSLRICSQAVCDGFEFPKEATHKFRNILHGNGLDPSHRWFLGLMNGRPVATSAMILHEDVAAIYCVATLPNFRGRGIGTAITREPLQVAKSAGYRVAVLEASAKGLPVYERIGFKELCRFRSLTWSP